ncbi:MAG TPA: 3'(2'),5'-bisphosphate nucleotidase CysQ [Desulfobacteraceae bacterium]|nr:3'(2'),5'-bisphosphate nucleotidase CysQ [Desulfobacteraceae bacterium]HPJ66844.1 3'(2'),5'-bisphosphate nucleotidase CysQ [Desulfobacteraceae bacterium]HPQ28584.1 3'(2'),5'-bisphosphate nucleotidase CysQ [Desulfobacteraceae bacterium]
MNINQLIMPAIAAAIEAGAAVLEIYRQAFAVEEKADKSPLTIADKRSHEIIEARLATFKFPLLSEEGKHLDYALRKNWDFFWIVDPLDGTKEFIKKNDEFTVNIALIQKNAPVMGVIYVPVLRQLYFAAREAGAFRITLDGDKNIDGMPLDRFIALATPIHAGIIEGRPFTIVGSRSHATKELEEYVEKKRKEYGDLDFIPAGSSLKFCRVAEGSADVYPRLGPTMEWDTAAGHIIAECAGASVFRADNSEAMRYNKEDLLNPWFFVSNGRH